MLASRFTTTFTKTLNNTFAHKDVLMFDLDGTLVDSAPDLAFAVNKMLQDIGNPPFSEDEIHGWVGNGAQVLTQRALSGSVNIAPDLDDEAVEQALKIFLDHYQNNLCVHSKLYSGVRETLHALKAQGKTLIVITNKPFKFIETILTGLKLDGVFEFTLGGDSLEKRKPDALPLLHSCEKLGVSVSQCVMIGDSKNDILAAKAAKMHSIGLTYGYNYGEDISIYGPDAVLDNFSELLPLFVEPAAIEAL